MEEKKINITLKLKHLSRMARKWDTKESQGVYSLFWGVLENRQEEFGILVNPEILINDVSEIQKEKRWQRLKSYFFISFLYPAANLIFTTSLVSTLPFPRILVKDMSTTSMFFFSTSMFDADGLHLKHNWIKSHN